VVSFALGLPSSFRFLLLKSGYKVGRASALLCLIVVFVQDPVAITASIVGISLSSSVRGVSVAMGGIFCGCLL